MLNEALARLGVEPQDALLIGDNPSTDGKGAHDLGIPFLQMGTVSSTRTATPLDISRAVKTIQHQPVLTLKERHDRQFLQI
jgi:FMN phosphatase YigB (HAD superfamily)